MTKANKNKGRARELLQASNHLDAEYLTDSESDSDEEVNDEERQYDEFNEKEQDLHCMLSILLQDMVAIQGTGFLWDFKYRGKVYRDVEFVLFVPFVKCDTDEAEKLCAKYRSRNGNVKHLCRYCHCPNEQTDDPMARFPFKTQNEIQKLIDKQDLEGLKNISQAYVNNAWYKV